MRIEYRISKWAALLVAWAIAAGLVERYWPELKPAVAVAFWVFVFIAVKRIRDLLVKDDLKTVDRLHAEVEKGLFSDNYWRQCSAISRLSIVTGRHFGLHSRQASALHAWRLWWRKEGMSLVWDESLEQYVEAALFLEGKVSSDVQNGDKQSAQTEQRAMHSGWE